jgi:DNA-binding MarR family transcriptional regulator
MLVFVAIETTKSADPQELAREAWGLFQRIAFADKPALVTAAREFDLLPPHVFALRHLDQPMPMGELARMLFCDNSNVTGIVDRLEERGLVARTADQHDRRVKLLVLTPEGENVRQELMERISVPPPSIAALAPEDLRALRDILRRAAEQLD